MSTWADSFRFSEFHPEINTERQNGSPGTARHAP